MELAGAAPWLAFPAEDPALAVQGSLQVPPTSPSSIAALSSNTHTEACSDPPDMLALTEEVLKYFVRLEFGSLRFVDAPPEKFVAL